MKFSGIDININRSKRKTISIYIERDGSVTARVPKNIKEQELVEIIQTREYQIHRALAQWKEANETKIKRQFVSGQSFLYLGRNYRLKLVDEKLGKLILRNGQFLISREEVNKSREYFIDFYKEKLNTKITPIIDRYKDSIGVKPNQIKVMELQNRWASCTSKQNVNFHWKCAMAPIDVLNYIVVHELVHLIHHNHTPAFWNELDKIYPNYSRQLDWLKKTVQGWICRKQYSKNDIINC